MAKPEDFRTDIALGVTGRSIVFRLRRPVRVSRGQFLISSLASCHFPYDTFCMRYHRIQHKSIVSSKILQQTLSQWFRVRVRIFVAD
jgi:hypothetical protein